MSSGKRKYELKARGDRQQETRRRIVEATAELHREIGPARTTVAEIARRAGVQRLTVYTHFPDDLHLISACQQHNFALNPPPDLDSALTRTTPKERLRTVLSLMYAWYRKGEKEFTPALQDRGTVPALDQVLSQVMDLPQAELATGLAASFEPTERHGQQQRAMIRLALDFWTWQRLKNEELKDAEIAEMMTEAVAALVPKILDRE